MTKIEQLRSLQERLDKATGPDRELDARIWCYENGKQFDRMASGCFSYFGQPGWNAYGLDDLYSPSSSIDAALALVERLLPGWIVSVYVGDVEDPPQANVWPKVHPVPADLDIYRDAPTPALAILRALVAALIAQAEASHVWRAD